MFNRRCSNWIFWYSQNYCEMFFTFKALFILINTTSSFKLHFSFLKRIIIHFIEKPLKYEIHFGHSLLLFVFIIISRSVHVMWKKHIFFRKIYYTFMNTIESIKCFSTKFIRKIYNEAHTSSLIFMSFVRSILRFSCCTLYVHIQCRCMHICERNALQSFHIPNWDNQSTVHPKPSIFSTRFF